MKNHFLHKTKFKNLIATLFLGLFLFANYGVNIAGLHHHESHQEGERKNATPHTDCYICDFQGLSYEPLTQQSFFTIQAPIQEHLPVNEYFVYLILSEYHHAIQQRGPPSMVG